MAKAAELILERPGMQSGAIYALFVTHVFCHHWTSPLHDAIAPLLKVYQAGLEIGDTDRACWCLMKRCYYLYFISRDLGSVQKELEATIHVLTQLKQDDTKLHISFS